MRLGVRAKAQPVRARVCGHTLDVSPNECRVDHDRRSWNVFAQAAGKYNAIAAGCGNEHPRHQCPGVFSSRLSGRLLAGGLLVRIQLLSIRLQRRLVRIHLRLPERIAVELLLCLVQRIRIGFQRVAYCLSLFFEIGFR